MPWHPASRGAMKTTDYFRAIKRRPDRSAIDDRWIERVVRAPEYRIEQADGRVRLWRQIPEAGGRWLRVILLADGETVHNAFFDRGFAP
ncbi:MAG TPA: hypothetical protein VK052_07860 [Zeimonas sp.]|nr:hypothetical protein [Zeimonas sp.]